MLLQTLLDFMRQLLSHLNPSMQVFPLQQHLSQMKSETASFPPICNKSCCIWIGDCKFRMILQQLLSQMHPRPHVLLPHRRATCFTGGASCAYSSPSLPCMMAKISKGDHFFSSWRYLYCLLVPGLPGCMKFWVNVAFCLPTEGRRTQFFHHTFKQPRKVLSVQPCSH